MQNNFWWVNVYPVISLDETTNVWRAMKGYEGLYRAMKGYEGLWRVMKGYEGIWSAMMVLGGFNVSMRGCFDVFVYDGLWWYMEDFHENEG